MWHGVGTELIFVSAVLLAVAAIFGLVVKWLRRSYQFFKRLEVKMDLLDDIPEMKKELILVRKEVTLNGGKTLKDEVVAAKVLAAEATAVAAKSHKNLAAALRKINTQLKIEDSRATETDNT